MREFFIALVVFSPSIACVIGAILLALNGIAGWGWFLFVAVLTGLRNVKYDDKEDKHEI